MKAKVVLTFGSPVTKKVVTFIKSLCTSLTVDTGSIVVERSEDKRTVAATFKRFPGRQGDIVDGIGRPFRDFLEDLDDIVIYFESRTKKFD